MNEKANPMKLEANSVVNSPRTSSLIHRIGDGSIITRFDKTPPPCDPTDVVCPHFLELKWATGCPFSCAWCYLQGTLRFQPTKAKPRPKDFGKIERHVKAFLAAANGHPEILNTGELADSLMHEKGDYPFSKFIIPLFQGSHPHRLLFVTKSTAIHNLLKIDHNNKAVVSFSLNAPTVAATFEKAPSPQQRIDAAAKLVKAGYEVRVRIDPLVPVPDWERQYKGLVDLVFTQFTPSRITLGSLRGLQSTINFSQDKRWVSYLSERSNWGRRVDFGLRTEMYQTMLAYLSEEYGFTEVGLCKETLAVWGAVGMDYTRIKCNCIM